MIRSMETDLDELLGLAVLQGPTRLELAAKEQEAQISLAKPFSFVDLTASRQVGKKNGLESNR